MAKYTYNVIVNDVDLKDFQQFRYTYSRMEMQITVSADSFIIIYETNVNKPLYKIWYSNEIEDAVRKCLLAQLIFFGHNCDFEKVLIKESSNDETKIIEKARVYNLIPSDVKVDLTPIRDKEFVAEYLMKRVKSKYESGIAAIFSYIYAKSKTCEEEMFTYYWRAFNGLLRSPLPSPNALQDDTLCQCKDIAQPLGRLYHPAPHPLRRLLLAGSPY